MRLVPLIVELPPRLFEFFTLRVTHRLDHIARLQKDLAHVRVNASEPSTELVVRTRVADEVVDSVEDDIERLAVGEAFEESADLGGGDFEVRVTVEGRVGVFAVLGDSLSVTNVFLEERQ